ncbi:MAG: type II secretion system protein GspN [Desulfuromonas sp.]|nr:MAG: type II secretion system protein GspN [Desulfuromonas sp.]
MTSMGRPKKWIDGLRGRFAVFLLTVLLFLTAVAIGFFTGLPEEAIRRRLVQELSAQTGMVAESQHLSIGFPGRATFDLQLDTGHPQLTELAFDRVRLDPVWTSLLSGAPRLSIEGLFADGSFHGQLSTDGSGQLAFEEVALDRLQNGDNRYGISGTLQGRGTGSQLDDQANMQGNFSLEGQALIVRGLEQMGLAAEVALGTCAVDGTLQGRKLTLEAVSVDGGFATLRGGGTVQLGPNPARTRLNIRLTATPGPDFPPSLKPLIELSGHKPKRDGSYQLRISGSLAKPIVR